jgi:hypothetical protein
MTSLDMAASPATLDRIRRHLVGLNMPRALEVIEHILRRIERGEISTLEAIDTLLGEELTLREGRRVRSALKMGRLITIKTLSGFDFSFQPSLDRFIFLVNPAAARLIWRWLWVSRQSSPAAPSISPPWPTSSVHSPRRSGRAPYANASAFSAGPNC